MIIEFDPNSSTHLTVVREPGDPRFYGAGHTARRPSGGSRHGVGGAYSRFLHHLKLAVNSKHGLDLVKQDPQSDGHMISDSHYLRSRDEHSPRPHVAIYDPQYAVRCAAHDFNSGKPVTLAVRRDIFDTSGNWET